jgi:hypothetical protein
METHEQQFFGRERIVREVVHGVLAPQPVSFSLVGSKLIGKTRLLGHLASPHGPLLDDAETQGRAVVAQIDCDRHEARQDIVAFIAARLAQQMRAAEDPELNWDHIEQEPDPSRRIWQIGRQLVQAGRRPVLLLDNCDTLFREQSLSPDAVDELRPLSQQMPLVVATEQPLHDLDQEFVAAPLVNAMTQVFIGLMEPDAADLWARSYCRDYPALTPVCADLLEMTGYHPFLLDRLGYILSDAQNMLTRRQQLGPEHLPLIRMRLAEHGRLLFVTLWRRLQSPPRRVDIRVVMLLLERLLSGPLPLDEVASEQSPTLNWLINQAIVVYGSRGYRLSCPLFGELLETRVGAGTAAQARSRVVDRGDSPFLNSLTKTEGALLRYFQTHSNTVVSPEQLLADVWNRPNASPRRVQEAIRRLRLRLDEAIPPVGVIENERGRGYRFIPAQT